MKEFSQMYQTTFSQASPHMIVQVMDKFTQHNWMLALTYNSLIDAFGKNFDSFSYRELASFSKSLSKVGLRQSDIISESIKKITSGAGKTIKEEEKTDSSYQVSFRSVILPLFEAITDLNLPQQDELLKELTDEGFIKRAVTGNLSFFEQATRNQADHQSLLLSILRGNLDKHDPKFKELAENLLAKINSSEYGADLNETSVYLYQALNFGNSGLSAQYSPKNVDKVKGAVDREFKNRKASNLYENSKLTQALHAIGYKDAKFNEAVNGFSLDIYSAEQNMGILTQDSETLCYDRIAPNGMFQLKSRVAGSLEAKPKLFTVNLFTLNGLADKEAKIKYLTEQCGIPLVGEKIDDSVQF
jgi:hypothetical protein